MKPQNNYERTGIKCFTCEHEHIQNYKEPCNSCCLKWEENRTFPNWKPKQLKSNGETGQKHYGKKDH